MVDLKILFEQFKREKQFLDGATAATLRSYSTPWLAFTQHAEILDMFFLPAPVASEGAIHKTQAQYGAGGTRKQLWIDNRGV